MAFLASNQRLLYVDSTNADFNLDTGAAHIVSEKSPRYVVAQGFAYGASNNGRMFLFEHASSGLRFRDVIVASTVDFKPGSHSPANGGIQDLDGDGFPDFPVIAKIGSSWHSDSFVLFISIRKGKFTINQNPKLYLSLYRKEKSKGDSNQGSVAEFVYAVLSKEMKSRDAVRHLKKVNANAADMLLRIGSWNSELSEYRNYAIQREVFLKGK